MKIYGLDGREYSWNLSQFKNQRPGASGPHKRARELLKTLFPYESIFEELTVPGCGTPLYLDFYLNGPKFGVEVNGQQHYEFKPFFYDSKSKWYQAQRRDIRKANWCASNGIVLVTLNDKDDNDEWTKQIRNRET